MICFYLLWINFWFIDKLANITTESEACLYRNSVFDGNSNEAKSVILCTLRSSPVFFVRLSNIYQLDCLHNFLQFSDVYFLQEERVKRYVFNFSLCYFCFRLNIEYIKLIKQLTWIAATFDVIIIDYYRICLLVLLFVFVMFFLQDISYLQVYLISLLW